MRFIVFERSSGHCHITLLTGRTLTDALTNFLAAEHGAQLDDLGNIVEGGVMTHPLAIIEREYKADQDHDELAVDDITAAVLSERSFEIRVLPEGALNVRYASVFTSAEPWYSAGEIATARRKFVHDFPGVEARAFFWYLRNGVLVTFFRIGGTYEDRTMEIYTRYLCPTGNERSVIQWSGSYDDLAEQMTFEFPF